MDRPDVPGPAVAEHLAQRLLLVGAQQGRRLQVNVDVGVQGVIPLKCDSESECK